MPNPLPPEDSIDLTAMVARAKRQEAVVAEAPAEDPPVSVPLEDVTQKVEATPELPVMDDRIVAAIEARRKLVEAAATAQEVWSRSSEKLQGETDQAHQERIKREFEAAVLAVRAQETAAPLPPMPVPRAISEQTRREMEAGAKQSAYWKEQQKQRPLPNAKEIQAAGVNTPVFRPGEYAHEKGGIDKHLVTQNMPGR